MTVFVDTLGLYAVLDRDDAKHGRAKEERAEMLRAGAGGREPREGAMAAAHEIETAVLRGSGAGHSAGHSVLSKEQATAVK